MTGWVLLLLIVIILNTVAIILYQRDNESRLDAHWKAIQQQAARTTDLIPVLTSVSDQIQRWEARREEDCRRAAEAATKTRLT
jgi:hypothetical protein